MEETRLARAITDAEWEELASLPAIRDAYGFLSQDGGPDLEGSSYGAHFDFISGSPGYVGDVYILLGDDLGGPMLVIRDQDGGLKVAGQGGE
jgi:hypothetical protein